MWRNPNHPQPEAPAPPRERGRRLLALPRGRSGDEELRVALDEYEGHPFVSVRVWSRGQDGGWWPVKGKGISIRLRELADVAEALREADDLLNGPDGSMPGEQHQGGRQ